MKLRHKLSRPSPVLFACLFASQSALLVLSPILPELARHFDVSPAAAGQLRTISGAIGGITAITLALSRRHPGLRTLLERGALTIVVSSVLSAAAPSFAFLAGAQALMGAGIGTLVAVGIAAAGEWTRPEERAQALSWAIIGMPAAWVVGMPLAGIADAAGWRATWLAVPGAAALVTFGLLRLRPADWPRARAKAERAGAWHPDVVRFAAGELLANGAWAAVLTYSGTLLIESYGASRATVAAGLGAMAVAMFPGTFVGRRQARRPTRAALVALTLAQGIVVMILGGLRPGILVTLALLSLMAFNNGTRSMTASALGMDSAPGDAVTMMAMRAAANQFGYLLGAAAGGAAIALGGFSTLGVVLAAMFALGAAAHTAPVPRLTAPAPAPAG